MKIKKHDDITWHDLPKIESHFFAFSDVKDAILRGQVNDIHGLGNLLFEMREFRQEAQLNKIERHLETGWLYLMKDDPISPQFQLIEPKEGEKQGEVKEVRILEDVFYNEHLVNKLRYPTSLYINPKSKKNTDLDTNAESVEQLADKTAQPSQSNNLQDPDASGENVVFLDSYSTPSASSDSSDSNTMHSDKSASQGPESPDCTFDVMTIQCSHDRSYKLDVIKDKPNLNGVDKALQVISKHGEPDNITVTYSGSCANGSKECPAIKISSDTLNGTFTDKPYKFDALPLDKEREPGDLIDFLKYYLVPDLRGLDYQVYNIEKSGCSGSEGNIAKVHAFPSFKWEGSASLGYDQTDGTNNDGKDFGQKKKKSEFGLKVGLKGNVGKKDWAFESTTKREAERYMPDIQNTMRGMIYKLDDYYRKADTSKGLVRFTITWPSISIGGNIELLEDKNNFSVDVGGEVYLKLDPLIKADIRTDILEWLIASTPLGPFLQKIKTKAADGIGSDKFSAKAIIAIDLVITGEASANLNWKKSASDKWANTSGDKALETKAGVTIGLEAKIQAEAKVFYVKITMGAELHVKGASSTSEGIGIFLSLYATTEKDKPAVGGKVQFTGAAIYYTYYAEIGKEDVISDNSSNQKRKRNSGSVFGPKTSQEHKLKEDRMEKLAEIFAADEWPKRGKSKTHLADL